MASDAAPLVGMEITPAEKVSGKAPATLQATAPSKKTIHFVAAFVLFLFDNSITNTQLCA